MYYIFIVIYWPTNAAYVHILHIPGVSKGCCLEVCKYLEAFKKHSFGTPGMRKMPCSKEQKLFTSIGFSRLRPSFRGRCIDSGRYAVPDRKEWGVRG